MGETRNSPARRSLTAGSTETTLQILSTTDGEFIAGSWKLEVERNARVRMTGSPSQLWPGTTRRTQGRASGGLGAPPNEPCASCRGGAP